MINIYFDMDGVLCNFYKTHLNYRLGELSDIDFKRFVSNKEFENLDRLDNGFILLSLLYHKIPEINIEVLSSSGSGSDFDLGTEVVKQKIKWLSDNVTIGIFKSLNFVTYKGYKRKFATPKSILIDDHLENVEQFTEGGGYGIFFNYESDPQEIFNEILKIIDKINSHNNLYS